MRSRKERAILELEIRSSRDAAEEPFHSSPSLLPNAIIDATYTPKTHIGGVPLIFISDKNPSILAAYSGMLARVSINADRTVRR